MIGNIALQCPLLGDQVCDGHHSLVRPIDWKLEFVRFLPTSHNLLRHHSLVTPIDWKRIWRHPSPSGGCIRHHSLVTPIDWKRRPWFDAARQGVQQRHHSLVTPIDWKLQGLVQGPYFATFECHHSLVTPIDWKPDRGYCFLNASILSASPLAGDTY